MNEVESKPTVIVVKSLAAPGLKVAICLHCRYTTMPGTAEQAQQWGEQHLASSHA